MNPKDKRCSHGFKLNSKGEHIHEKLYQEIERSSKEEWEQYFKDNQGKIPNKWPKTFLDIIDDY